MISIISTTCILEKKRNYWKSKAKSSWRMALYCKQARQPHMEERLFSEDDSRSHGNLKTFHHWLSPAEHLPQQTGKARSWVPILQKSSWALRMRHQAAPPCRNRLAPQQRANKAKHCWVAFMQKQKETQLIFLHFLLFSSWGSQFLMMKSQAKNPDAFTTCWRTRVIFFCKEMFHWHGMEGERGHGGIVFFLTLTLY